MRCVGTEKVEEIQNELYAELLATYASGQERVPVETPGSLCGAAPGLGPGCLSPAPAMAAIAWPYPTPFSSISPSLPQRDFLVRKEFARKPLKLVFL